MSLKKKLATSLATISLVGALVGGATFALFTDSATSSTSFTAGKVDIAACPTVNVPIECLAPGDRGSFDIILTNEACLDFRYDIAQSLTGALADGANGLQVTLKDQSGNIITPGDNNIAFAAGDPNAAQRIIVEYYLPLEAGNEYALTSADLALTFNAEQTKNN